MATRPARLVTPARPGVPTGTGTLLAVTAWTNSSVGNGTRMRSRIPRELPVTQKDTATGSSGEAETPTVTTNMIVEVRKDSRPTSSVVAIRRRGTIATTAIVARRPTAGATITATANGRAPGRPVVNTTVAIARVPSASAPTVPRTGPRAIRAGAVATAAIEHENDGTTSLPYLGPAAYRGALFITLLQFSYGTLRAQNP